MHLFFSRNLRNLWHNCSQGGCICQEKAHTALTPNDFGSLDELQERLLRFQHKYEQIAKPFEWKFTRNDLNILLNKIKPSSASVEK
jgi:hypothetical protein